MGLDNGTTDGQTHTQASLLVGHERIEDVFTERRVTLRTAFDAQLVYVEVSDSGPGVDPALGERIFDSFVTSKQGGLGMGLAISRSIVEATGGTLRYVANPGGGATFTFSLAREAV